MTSRTISIYSNHNFIDAQIKIYEILEVTKIKKSIELKKKIY